MYNLRYSILNQVKHTSQSPRLLLARRVTLGLPLSDMLLPYIREAGFGHFHGHPTWQWIEDLLSDRPPSQLEDKKQNFGLKMTWLRNRVTHIPPGVDAATLGQYARCYLLMLIGGYLFTDKSANLVPVRWMSLSGGL
ncbi:hypothetical protein AHAS_Ahas11G0068900 [Arachis hypogaea]